MRIKAIIIVAMILFQLPFCGYSQLTNINPNPNGDPWMVGGIEPFTPEMQNRKDNIPVETLFENANNVQLPLEVFNNNKIWFPDPFYQQPFGCCGVASAIHFGFTYEINRLRNLPGTEYENQYCVSFTWNMLNRGDGNKGAQIFDILEIVKNNGHPSKSNWNIPLSHCTEWMSGYDNYLQGIQNTIDSFTICDISTIDGYETMLNWIHNHNNGEDNGGIAPFTCIMEGYQDGYLPEGDYQGQYYISSFGPGSIDDHAMTVVGYSDKVVFDLNGDGEYTNGQDLDSNQIIDLRDYEIGALYIVNSWGGWGMYDHGFAWVPCHVLYNDSRELPSYFIHAIAEYEPEYTAKIKLSHEERDKFYTLAIAASDEINAVPPMSNVGYAYLPIDFRLGGPFPLLGYDNNDPLYLEFDITPVIDDLGTDPHTFFLFSKNHNTYGDGGTIHQFSIVDRTGTEPFEFYCHETDVPITDQLGTVVTLDYNVLPATIMQNEDIDYNCIVRNTTTIESSNFDFTGKYLDFYDNGHLIIKANSNVGFTAPSGMKFFAMRKTGILELQGPANFNPFSSFNTFQVNRSEEHYFKLLLNTQSEDYNFSGNVFRNTRLEGFSNSIVLNSCIFENCDIDYSWGDFYVQETGGGNSNFTNSCIKISRPFNASKTVNITNSSFDGSGIYDDLLYIEEYDNFTLNSNNFKNASGNGIYLFDAGHGLKHYIGNNELISDCGEQVPLSAGICMYNSIADIINNDEISGSPIGIKMYRYSDATIKGNQSAGSASETQQIADNDINQIYITPGSDPWYCHWNAIMDDDNTSPLYYIAPSPDWDGSGIDATNNYWGNYFNPSEDLSPGINYVPIWNLAFMEEHLNETQQMYNSAWEMAEDSNYTEAQNTLKLLVSTYPDSNLAITSMKDIFALEDEAGADYDSLKYYFENESAIQSDTILQKLAEFLVSMCDLKIENYQAAIDTYDSIIQNPSSEQDSIFAIIDLAYTYQLQEDSGSRNIYIGSFPQYKYANYKDFSKSRKYHLSLLHKDSPYMEPRNPQKIIGNDQFICYPNPSQGNIRISFKGDNDKRYSVKIFNGLGELVWEDILQGQTENIRTYNLKHFPRGMYVIQLREGNREVSSKKIFRM